jgi:heat shock protein HtpX
MATSPSVTARALLAVGLMIGFYLLAVFLAAGLLWIPYAEWQYANRLHFRIALFCVIGAGVILWSIVPRVDKFMSPGPQLSPAEHPRLFAELNGIAGAVQQAMPAEVYLVSDVNAWVSQRGGVMGFGSKRVMGLGLPLLRVLKVSELRAVLAHEFGHYYGGDTKLGPWVYKTRGAIGRTLEGLAQHSSSLQLPFIWYGKMFVRITHAVSRRQEFSADELAARTVGARPMISGLQMVHGAGLAFDPYWSQEFMSALESGYRPPLADGFASYLRSSEDAEQLVKVVTGSALAVALARAGYTVNCFPGAPVTFHKEGQSLDPFTILPRLITSELSADAWRQQCAELGIAGADLGVLGPDTQKT